MSSLGSILKQERERRGLSLHEVALSLKINQKILKAIEEGEKKNLPAKTFLRGFIKSYAHYLRLDEATVLAAFSEEYGIKEQAAPASPTTAAPSTEKSNPEAAPSPARPPAQTMRRSSTPVETSVSAQKLWLGAGVGVLLVAIFVVSYLLDKYQKESLLPTEASLPADANAPAEAPPTTAISGPTTTLVGGGLAMDTTTTTSTVPMTSTSAARTSTTLVSPTTTTRTSVTPTTTTTTVPKIVPTTLPTTTLAPTTTLVTSTTTTLATSNTTTTTTKPRLTEVIVEAFAKVSITYDLGEGVKTLSLDADQVHTFRSRRYVELSLSDGGSINIIVNGRDRGSPGSIGKPVKVRFP